MSIIREILKYSKEQEASCVEEALRFGSKEKAEILKRSNEFMIGLEFEFIVDEGLDHISAANESTPELDVFTDRFEPHVIKLAESVAALLNANKQTIQNLAADFIDAADDADAAVIDSIIEYDFNIAMGYINDFTSVVLQSLNLKKTPYSIVLKKHGLWGGDTNSPEFSHLSFIRKNEGTMILLNDDQKLLLVLKAGQVLMSISDYLRNSVSMVNNMPKLSIQKEMMRLLKSVYVELNPNANYKTQKTKSDVVREKLPLPTEWLDGVVPDLTVNEGAEVVTKPLSLQNARKALEIMSPFIKEMGGTSQKTGLHVNVSMKHGFSKINTAKVITMLDPEFFQNLSPSSKKKFKYKPRFMVENVFDTVSIEEIQQLARTYVFGGAAKFVKEYENLINFKSIKETAINMEHFFYAETAGTRRIEFRFFGGYGYENRTEEIYGDMLNVLYAMFIASDETFKREEYLSTIIRQLNRSVNKKKSGLSFSDLIMREKEKRS